MVASVHKLQFVHSATSMIMFHFFIGVPSEQRVANSIDLLRGSLCRCSLLPIRYWPFAIRSFTSLERELQASELGAALAAPWHPSFSRGSQKRGRCGRFDGPTIRSARAHWRRRARAWIWSEICEESAD